MASVVMIKPTLSMTIQFQSRAFKMAESKVGILETFRLTLIKRIRQNKRKLRTVDVYMEQIRTALDAERR